jgi:hypothetical protein
MTKSNLGGISDEDLSNLGYIDTPDGNPPSFDDRNWLLSSASENKTRGDGKTVRTWTKTWMLSPQGETWDADIYTKLT